MSATPILTRPTLILERLAGSCATTPDSNSSEGRDEICDVGYTVINYNTAIQTLRCVTSLAQCSPPPAWILVLDNASSEPDLAMLTEGLRGTAQSHVQLFRSERNLGFAGGSNFLIDQLLAFKHCTFIGMLNNDAIAKPEMVGRLREVLAATDFPVGMAGGRMHKLNNPQVVDTLGITLYASLMPGDRRTIEDPYLGPTGGCCMMTRAFVQDVKATSGYCFDERFFCYCEDTDLVLRANLLGYRPAYVDLLLALHEGQASSQIQRSDFIIYQTQRNQLWMLAKFIPALVLRRNFHWIVVAHLMTLVRHVLSGRPRVMFIVYRDALKQLPLMLRERDRFQEVARVAPSDIRKVLSPRIFRQGFIGAVLVGWLNSLRNIINFQFK